MSVAAAPAGIIGNTFSSALQAYVDHGVRPHRSACSSAGRSSSSVATVKPAAP